MLFWEIVSSVYVQGVHYWIPYWKCVMSYISLHVICDIVQDILKTLTRYSVFK